MFHLHRDYHEEQKKFKAATKENIPKKKSSREEQTLAILEKFKAKLSGTVVLARHFLSWLIIRYSLGVADQPWFKYLNYLACTKQKTCTGTYGYHVALSFSLSFWWKCSVQITDQIRIQPKNSDPYPSFMVLRLLCADLFFCFGNCFSSFPLLITYWS